MTSPRLREGIKVIPNQLKYSWGTIFFFIAIHVLALIALQPAFWSQKGVVTLLVLYWLTACIGVTLGYHRLLAHS
ncbi:MAG: acyl-CoA desaturase, partial [Prochlorococcaceae cyanobacterium ETNP1_MAG_9]|nr:acyl-CoA desaturase [Prochlorococcaceae cyanobacterium ETNP1_MAG_9]